MKVKQDEQIRINSTLKVNFENLKQAYDLNLISEREDKQSEDGDQKVKEVYTYVELRDPKNPEEYVYGTEADLIFEYKDLGLNDKLEDGASYELLPTKEDILYEKYYKYGGLKFKLIIADAKIYPGIILYLYNKPYEILKQFILHYKDCADFVPISSLERDAKYENGDVKVKFFEFLANSISYRDGKFNLKGMKYYKSMNEFVTERSMHVETDDANDSMVKTAYSVFANRKTANGESRGGIPSGYNVTGVIGKTYRKIKTIQGGSTRRLFFTKKEIDDLKFTGK